MKRYLLSLVLLCTYASAQTLYSGSVNSSAWVYGQKTAILIPGAQMTVCSDPPTMSNGVCTNTIALYADRDLSHGLPNPLTLDANSNYRFYASVSALWYSITKTDGTKSGPYPLASSGLDIPCVASVGGGLYCRGGFAAGDELVFGVAINPPDGLTADYTVILPAKNGTLATLDDIVMPDLTPYLISSTAATTYVPKAQQVIAGTGLAGGGALSGDVTVSLAPQPVDVGVTYNGKPPTNAVVVRHPFPFAVSIPSGCTNSSLILETATTASLTVSLKKNGTEFGTATFAAGGTTANFSCTATSFAAGDILKVVFPAQDATAADLGGTIYGTR